MRPSLKKLLRYRPRFLTVVVFAAVAALLVLANLSDDVRVRRMPARPVKDMDDFQARLRFDAREASANDWVNGGPYNVSYGWPLLWRQYVVGVYFQVGGASVVYGELRSTGRLAANVPMWLTMLAAPTIACEWLLRRYRPRLRWSLRTMLAVVGLVAAGCGWYVSARNRIKVEKPLISAIERAGGHVWVDHYGPDWLGLLGANRLRTHIIGAYLGRHHDDVVEELLERLVQVPKLQYLFVNVDQWTSRMTAALRQMRHLRALSIEGDTPLAPDDALAEILVNKPRLRALSIDLRHSADSEPAQTSRELLTAIGKVTKLESLRVVHATIPIDSLSHLGGLAGLKSIILEDVAHNLNGPIGPPSMFAHLPVLPRLEAVSLPQSAVGDGDLHQLQRLPCLKLLDVTGTYVTRAGLAKLAALKSLEELAIDEEVVSAEGLMELQKLNRLRSLHINGFSGQCGPEDEIKREQLAGMPEKEGLGSIAALNALRRSKADLVIDGDQGPRDWDVRVGASLRSASLDRGLARYVRKALRQWKEEQANKHAAAGPN